MVWLELNGKLSEKAVTEWFSALDFDQQRSFLSALAVTHDKIREAKRDSLMQQLSALDGETSRKRGRPAGKARLVKKRKGKVAAKYRDPKTGDTWSGRGAHGKLACGEGRRRGKGRQISCEVVPGGRAHVATIGRTHSPTVV